MSNSLTGKPQLNRFVNRRLILDRIRRDGEISRAELAKQTAIRPPTVSAVVKELITEGLVEEVGAGETSGGRAPRMIALSRNEPKALGFEMSETAILAGLCDLGGSLCSHHRVPYSPQSPDQALDHLHEIGSELLHDAGVDWQKLQGVGVAVPGHLKTDEGLIRWSSPLNWRDVPFKELCEQRWGLTTDVVNDSLAGGMAAHLFDTPQSIENLVFLYIKFHDTSLNEIGLGTGIIINGEPFHGEFGAAGEITTEVTHPLVHAEKLGGQRFDSVIEFANALQQGNTAAVQAMVRVGEESAILVQHIVNLLEPGVLMVGSDSELLRDTLLDQWQGVLEERSLAYEAGKTQLMASTLGEFGVVRGAIVPTLQRVFRIPQWS
jgi:predicted NBD/HSP70 family sugar kinase